MSLINNNVNDDTMKQHEYQQQSVLTMQKSVTITVTPQRSNSLDYLNFEEKRQLIASSLSLSDILQVGPAVAQVAKEASTVIGKDQIRLLLLLHQQHLFITIEYKTTFHLYDVLIKSINFDVNL